MILFDFRDRRQVEQWRTIGDRVMGGRSESRLYFAEEGAMVFEGRVSLRNRGGFASIRSEAKPHDCGGTAGLLLEFKGDGKRYRISLRCDPSFDGLAYQAGFEGVAGEARTLFFGWEEFRPTYHGRPMAGPIPLNPREIISFGFIVGEKQEGPFSLEVYRIEAK